MFTDLVLGETLEGDISIVCRICLKNDGTMPIFPDIAPANEYTLREKIMSFAYVEIAEDDGLPSRICKKCCTQINSAFKLKALCEYSDFFLRQHLTAKDNYEEDDQATEDMFVIGNDAEEEATRCVVEEVVLDHLSPSDKAVITSKQFSSNSNNMIDSVEQLEVSVSSAANVSEDRLKITINADKPVVIVEKSKNVNENVAINNHVLDGQLPLKILNTSKSNEKDVQLNKRSNFSTKKKEPKIGKRERVIEGVTEVHKCVFCDKAYSFEGSLANHILKEHESTGEYPCIECGRTFTQEILLNMHVKIHTSERPYCCSYCGKCFRLLQTLQSHERVHKGKRKYLCNHCGKFFTSTKKHICPLANSNREKTYECNICGKKFLRPETLTIHSKRHRLVERYRCKTCSKPFYSRQELERHTNVHLGIRPFSCDFNDCEHTFYTKGELNRHMRYHRGEKKFKCDQCELSFFESGHLVNHKRKHTGERPYICEVCSKSFTDSSKLRRHVNIHYNVSSHALKTTQSINLSKS